MCIRDSRKLLDGWDGPLSSVGNNIAYDAAAANLTAYERRLEER